MNKQRKVLITITYNEMGIIIDTKAEEVAQPNLQPTCNQLATDCISRQAAIDTEGLDEQIKCEMCRNPMHTVRGCDGNCKYDEKLYERIMQILDERIKPLPSAQPYLQQTCNQLATDTISRQAAPERKRGEWTDDNACPFCGFHPWYERDIHTLSFCPNCGAKMEG